jgi:hypothetical protein
MPQKSDAAFPPYSEAIQRPLKVAKTRDLPREIPPVEAFAMMMPVEAVPSPNLRCPYHLPYGYEGRGLLKLQRERVRKLLRRYPKVKQGLGQVLSVTQLGTCWEIPAAHVPGVLERIVKRSRGQVKADRGYDDGTGTMIFERPWWRDYMPREETIRCFRVYVGPDACEPGEAHETDHR